MTVNGFMKQYGTDKQYSADMPQGVIEWQERKWTIDVLGAPSIDFILENSVRHSSSVMALIFRVETP